MSDNLAVTVASTIVAWTSMLGGIWVLFERADAVLKTEVKHEIAVWLSLPGRRKFIRELLPTFINLFEGFFGTRHFSLRCFFRSFIMTIVGMIFVLSLSFVINPDVLGWNVRGIGAVLFIGTAAVLFNVVPDYLSLLVIRRSLAFFQRNFSETWLSVRIVLLIAFCFLITVCMFLSFAIFGWTIVVGSDSGWYIPHLIDTVYRDVSGAVSNHALEDVLNFLMLKPKGACGGGFACFDIPSPGILIYTALLPLLWLMGFLGAAALLRIAGAIASLRYWLSKFMDVNQAPVKCLGYMTMMLASAAFLVLFCLSSAYVEFAGQLDQIPD